MFSGEKGFHNSGVQYRLPAYDKFKTLDELEFEKRFANHLHYVNKPIRDSQPFSVTGQRVFTVSEDWSEILKQIEIETLENLQKSLEQNDEDFLLSGQDSPLTVEEDSDIMTEHGGSIHVPNDTYYREKEIHDAAQNISCRILLRYNQRKDYHQKDQELSQNQRKISPDVEYGSQKPLDDDSSANGASRTTRIEKENENVDEDYEFHDLERYLVRILLYVDFVQFKVYST